MLQSMEVCPRCGLGKSLGQESASRYMAPEAANGVLPSHALVLSDRLRDNICFGHWACAWAGVSH